MLENSRYTAPNNFPVVVSGFDTEEKGEAFGRLVGQYAIELSQYFDLSQLDGITLAFDYKQALLRLDRGVVTSNRLTPSDEYVSGVAMTSPVIRNEKVKSHIVLDANYAICLDDPKDEDFKLAFHLLAHECAHVEITHCFDKAFPGLILQKAYPDPHDALRWPIILSCWDEYAASRLSANFGKDPTEGYEDTFLLLLNETRSKANELIKAYRGHRNTYQIVIEVYSAYGSLMKFASYHLGNMAGRNLSILDLPRTKASLENHWFASYFERLNTLCNRLMDDYGRWKDLSLFELLGDLADELVIEGGVTVSHLANGSLHAAIPYTPETIPK